MARRFSTLFLLFGLLPAMAGAAPDSFKFGRFGTVPIVRPAGEPSKVVLLFSGDKGLGEREAAMAKALAAAGALVFEVDTAHYFSTAGHGGGRLFPAVEFESLSQIGQKEVGLKDYRKPVLMGTGAGASLVYVGLAEAPPDTFAGAVSDGFCPAIPSDRLFRHGNGLEWDPKWKGPGIRLLPGSGIENPWILLDRPGAPCPQGAGTPREFAKKIDTAQILPAPAGVPAQEAWKKQLPQALAILAEKQRQEDAKLAARGELKDLPLIEIEPQGPAKDALAVIVTGSGGYVGLDRKVGNQLSLRGVPALGLSSLGYFWKPRTPQGSSGDLARILKHYLAAWHKSRAIVIGYSQGADVVPFMVAQLPPDLRAKVSVVALIGPDGEALFDMHPDGWITNRPQKPGLPVAPQVPKLKGSKVLCIYGEDEKQSMCKRLAPGLAAILEVPGGHGFEGDAPRLVERFLKESGIDPNRVDGGQGGKRGKGKP
jgi:type IV secretory pathway VirJ component